MMGLTSIYAEKGHLQETNNRYNKTSENSDKNSRILERIEESNKKYSLKDLNNAIEAKYNKNRHKVYDDALKKDKIESVRHNNRRKNDTTNTIIATTTTANFNNAIDMTLSSANEESVASNRLAETNMDEPINNDHEEDILMEDISDANDIQMVSNYLTQQRLLSSNNANSSNYIQEFHNNNFLPNNDIALEPTKLQTVYVIDTNFIISQLQTLEGLRQLSQIYHHVLVVPTTTIAELDGLKSSTSTTIAKHARAGNMWLYKNLAEANSGIIGQKLRQRLNPDAYKDDSILDCCLYFKEKLGCFVILLSNDKNLCLKALTEEILTVSYRDGMTSELIASKSYQENCARFGNNTMYLNLPYEHNNNEIYDNTYLQKAVNAAKINDSNTDEHLNPTTMFASMTVAEKAEVIYMDIQFVVTITIKSIMNDEYGEDLPYIDFKKEQLKTLQDCSHCIYSHWISVFSDYFRHSKIKREDWKKLPACLISIPKSQEDIDNMIFFWQDILENLFIKKSEQEYHQLKEYFFKWKQLKNK